MSDNKEDRGPADRARIALGEPYEISYWTKELGVSGRASRSREAGRADGCRCETRARQELSGSAGGAASSERLIVAGARRTRVESPRCAQRRSGCHEHTPRWRRCEPCSTPRRQDLVRGTPCSADWAACNGAWRLRSMNASTMFGREASDPRRMWRSSDPSIAPRAQSRALEHRARKRSWHGLLAGSARKMAVEFRRGRE